MMQMPDADRRRLLHRWWWAGWIAAVCIRSLLEDVVGKERWLRMERDGWITPWITVPLALGGLAWTFVVELREAKIRACPQAEVAGRAVRLVRWGWDCIDCQGDFGANDSCDSCGGTNRIPVYVTEADAERFERAGGSHDR